MNCCEDCPRLENGPTAAEIQRRFSIKRREWYVNDAAAAIIAGRGWPIGHKLGFPSITSRNAYEKMQAAIVREACGESAVDELRAEVGRRVGKKEP